MRKLTHWTVGIFVTYLLFLLPTPLVPGHWLQAEHPMIYFVYTIFMPMFESLVVSMLPDVDLRFGHRKWYHSFWGYLLTSGVFAGFYILLFTFLGLPFNTSLIYHAIAFGLVAAIPFLTHLALDSCTRYGIKWFYPRGEKQGDITTGSKGDVKTGVFFLIIDIIIEYFIFPRFTILAYSMMFPLALALFFELPWELRWLRKEGEVRETKIGKKMWDKGIKREKMKEKKKEEKRDRKYVLLAQKRLEWIYSPNYLRPRHPKKFEVPENWKGRKIIDLDFVDKVDIKELYKDPETTVFVGSDPLKARRKRIYCVESHIKSRFLDYNEDRRGYDPDLLLPALLIRGSQDEVLKAFKRALGDLKLNTPDNVEGRELELILDLYWKAQEVKERLKKELFKFGRLEMEGVKDCLFDVTLDEDGFHAVNPLSGKVQPIPYCNLESFKRFFYEGESPKDVPLTYSGMKEALEKGLFGEEGRKKHMDRRFKLFFSKNFFTNPRSWRERRKYTGESKKFWGKAAVYDKLHTLRVYTMVVRVLSRMLDKETFRKFMHLSFVGEEHLFAEYYHAFPWLPPVEIASPPHLPPIEEIEKKLPSKYMVTDERGLPVPYEKTVEEYLEENPEVVRFFANRLKKKRDYLVLGHLTGSTTFSAFKVYERWGKCMRSDVEKELWGHFGAIQFATKTGLFFTYWDEEYEIMGGYEVFADQYAYSKMIKDVWKVVDFMSRYVLGDFFESRRDGDPACFLINVEEWKETEEKNPIFPIAHFKSMYAEALEKGDKEGLLALAAFFAASLERFLKELEPCLNVIYERHDLNINLLLSIRWGATKGLYYAEGPALRFGLFLDDWLRGLLEWAYLNGDEVIKAWIAPVLRMVYAAEDPDPFMPAVLDLRNGRAVLYVLSGRFKTSIIEDPDLKHCVYFPVYYYDLLHFLIRGLRDGTFEGILRKEKLREPWYEVEDAREVFSSEPAGRDYQRNIVTDEEEEYVYKFFPRRWIFFPGAMSLHFYLDWVRENVVDPREERLFADKERLFIYGSLVDFDERDDAPVWQLPNEEEWMLKYILDPQAYEKYKEEVEAVKERAEIPVNRLERIAWTNFHYVTWHHARAIEKAEAEILGSVINQYMR